MADQISNIVDVGGITSDLNKVVDGIVLLEGAIKHANDTTLKVTVDYKGVETLNQYSEATQRYQKAIGELSAVEAQQIQLTQQMNALNEMAGVNMGVSLQHYANLKIKIFENNSLMQQYASAIEKANASLKDLGTYSASARAQLESGYIKTINDAKEAVSTLIVENKLLATEVTKSNQVISGAVEKRIAKQMESEEKLIQKMVLDQEKLVESYAKTEDKIEQKTLANDLKKLEAQEATIRKMIAAQEKLVLAQDAASDKVAQRVLANELKKVEAAQVAAIKQEAAAEKAANKSIFTWQNFTNVFQRQVLRMASSMILWGGVISVITAISEAVKQLIEDMKILSHYNQMRLDFYKLEAKSSQTAAECLGKEKAAVEILYATSQNLNISYKDRELAAKKLQDLYPDYLGNLSKEAILAGDAATAYNKLIEAIERSAKTKGIENTLSQVETDMTLKQKRLGQLKRTDPDILSGKDRSFYYPKDFGEEERLQREIEFLQEKKDSLLQSVDAPLSTDQKVKKGKAPKKDNAKELDAELKLEQEKYKLQVETNQLIYDNSRKTFAEQKELDDRNLQASQEHGQAMTDIITKWQGKVGESETKYAERKVQEAADQIRVDNALNESEAKIAKEIQDRHIKEGEAMDAYIEKFRKARQELTDLNRELDEIKAKGRTDHAASQGSGPFLEALGFDSSFKSDQANRDTAIAGHKTKISSLNDEEGQAALKNDGLKMLEIQSSIEKEKIDIAKLEAEKQEAIDAKVIEGKKKIAEEAINLAQTTFDAINTIRNNSFAQEEQQLEIQQRQLQITSKQKIDAINATTNFQITKDNQAAAVVAQTTAQQNALQQQQNQLALKKAKSDKTAAESGILLSTALAIAKALPLLADPATIPLGIAEIALITATGAVQYQAASSTPLPQFEHGGTTATPTFVAGEAGPELGITPGGKAVMFTKPGIYSAPIGTDIKTAEETRSRIINYAINGIGFNANSIAALQGGRSDISTKKIEDKLDDLTDATIQAAMAGRVVKNTVFVITGNKFKRN